MRPMLAALPAAIFAMAVSTLPGPQSSRCPDPDWMPLPVAEGPYHFFSGCFDGHVGNLCLRWGPQGEVVTRFNGRPVPASQLVRRLLVFAERQRDVEHPDQPSEVWVNLHVEPDIPWREVRRVLDACEHPDVRIYKIWFAVWPSRQ